MNGELELVSKMMTAAVLPEDIFGKITGTPEEKMAQAKSIYHRLAKITHPDVYRDVFDRQLASKTFQRLNQFWEEAKRSLTDGTYGRTPTSFNSSPIKIKAGRKEYSIVDQVVSEGVLANTYLGTYMENGKEVKAFFKIARESVDNDLLANEAQILRLLFEDKKNEKLQPYLQSLIDSFSLQTGGVNRRVNVLSELEGFYSLKEVRESYPHGIDLRDMAWIWRRLLVVLGFAHANEIIHGAITPENVFIHPEYHGLVLTEWSFAAREAKTTGDRVKGLDLQYERWYPKEVTSKKTPNPSTDIYLAAWNMVYLLGKDPGASRISDTFEGPMQTFFEKCLAEKSRDRPQDAWGLLEEFDGLIVKLWGPRKYHAFRMPSKL